MKQMGERSAGNPHPAFDVAGAGNVAWSREAADKAENLAGCKSPYRQLPVFGRLAYPERAEVTKHDVPGRRSPGCPAAVFAAVGTIWGGEQTWRPEHNEIPAAPKCYTARSRHSRTDAESRPNSRTGEGRWRRGRNRCKHTEHRRGMGSSIQEKILELTSGSCRGQQGLVTTCKDSPNEARNRRRREPNGSGA